MRITFLANKLHLGRGGSNHSLNLLSTQLEDRGHDIRVVTFNFGGPNQIPADTPYDVVSKPPMSSTRAGGAAHVYQTVINEGEETDLLHVFDPTIVPIAGWYKRNGGICPVVGRLNTYSMFCTNNDQMDGNCYKECTVRAKFAHDNNGLAARLASLPKYTFDTTVAPSLASEVDRLFALSPAARDVYESIGVDSEKISVVPNFYDPSFPTDRVVDKCNRSAFSILYVGRLHRKKGVDVLLDSLNRVPDTLNVHIVGDGPNQSKLERQAARLRSDHDVTFHGWVSQSELPSFYNSADVFVHPGRWPEPFGRTILEAIQCDCPPIVSDVGAPPWIVQDDKFVFNVNDSESLAETLMSIQSNPSCLDDYQSHLHDRIKEFAPGRIIDRLEHHYYQCITVQ